MLTSPPFSLSGLTALITGGASGIGEATCRAFHSAGASLIIADLDKERAERLAAELGRATVLNLDITNENEVRDAIAGVGKLDILVNNAGIGLVGNIEETGLSDFQRVFRVNVEGLYLMTKYCLPLLKAADPGPGKIVNIGSVAGLIGVKRRFAYCASKGAVVALTRQLSVDYPNQIRANCICPGTIETPFVEGYLKKYHAGEEEQTREELHHRQPVGRMGKPEEIASLALYLASGEANFIQGSVISIDGGWTAA
jgi:2-keto-3-deoxy-L-fuconate dehydrogenase